MPVKKGPSGERSVEAEAIVPGTPEEVWAAIATGPGISSWFVPSTSEERVGGTAVCNFGPGMESVATITAWDAPRRFVAETEDEPGKVASEWTVEARDGGTCTVRVVHRWFADTDDWDAQFEGHAIGWEYFFRVLKLYLEHFSGEPCEALQLAGMSEAPLNDVWRAASESLVKNAGEGDTITTPSAPAIVERRHGNDAYSELLLRLDNPTPGLAHLFPLAMESQTMLSVRVFLYGEQAKGAAESARRQWEQWLNGSLP